MAYILAIDDNAVIRDVILFTLQDRHSVTLASNAEEGFAQLEASHFDLIITDIKMPEMNGIDFVKEVRKNSSYASTPILILTANLTDYKQAIKDSGATGWIKKPFVPEQLLETITEVLK